MSDHHKVHSALRFEVVAEWNRARSGRLYLPHAGLQQQHLEKAGGVMAPSNSSSLGESSAGGRTSLPIRTPVFMPVGTQGTLKGVLHMETLSGPRSLLGANAAQATRTARGSNIVPSATAMGNNGRAASSTESAMDELSSNFPTHTDINTASPTAGTEASSPSSSPTPKTFCDDVEDPVECRLILGNTYHLGHRPGPDLLADFGGLHQFMGWKHALLTDSGGFQMVSLSRLAEITEHGVQFQSPHDGSTMMLTPEESMRIQNAIGADIMMALDDVVHSSTTGARLEEAMERTLRWIDRCIAAHARPEQQNLFGIIQGGLNPSLRDRCLDGFLIPERDGHLPGYAIGGLSGGESKSEFWRIVDQCTARLPAHKPRYLMGVGYAVDMVVCSSLGVDMFDCVFPTRTARFGTALVPDGNLHLRHERYAQDHTSVDPECCCDTCLRYTRSYIHSIARQDEAQAGQLLSIHNVAYQMRLMRQVRGAIEGNCLDDFVKAFMRRLFAQELEGANRGVAVSEKPSRSVDDSSTAAVPEPKHASGYPLWCVEALQAAKIDILR